MAYTTAAEINRLIREGNRDMIAMTKALQEQIAANGGQYGWDFSVHPPRRVWIPYTEPAEPRRPA